MIRLGELLDVSDVLDGINNYAIVGGEALDVLRSMPSASVDAIVTDPPAGVAFMGKEWDDFRRARNPADAGGWKDVPGCACAEPDFDDADRRFLARSVFVATIGEIMAEALRVLKPGGHALVWALPRTSHWTAMALEEAGFDVRDRISHFFGSGFPKSLNVSKAIDDAARGEPQGGAKPSSAAHGAFRTQATEGLRGDGDAGKGYGAGPGQFMREGGARANPRPATTDEAKRWEGFGTALKPAVEDWWLCRKPLDGTVAANVLKHGTGGLNIDECRVAYQSDDDKASATPQGKATSKPSAAIAATPDAGRGLERVEFERPEQKGRWPSHLLLSHAEGCEPIGTKRVRSDGHYPAVRPAGSQVSGPSGHVGQEGLVESRTDGEEAEAWRCVDGCPIAEMDRQSGKRKSGAGNFRRKRHETNAMAGSLGDPREGVEEVSYGDEGGASRFFPTFHYAAKASRKERNAGGLVENKHPTVKSLDLMRWLCRLITPPGGVVLDPFAGSGSTGVAALQEGFRFIGIEREPDYLAVAKARLKKSLDSDP